MISAAALLLLASAAIAGDGIRLEFDADMRSRVVMTQGREDALGPFTESEVLLTADGEVGGFQLQDTVTASVTDTLGAGERTTLTGHSRTLVKQVEVTRYAAHPQWLFVRVRYRNGGTTPIEMAGYASHRYEMTPAAVIGVVHAEKIGAPIPGLERQHPVRARFV